MKKTADGTRVFDVQLGKPIPAKFTFEERFIPYLSTNDQLPDNDIWALKLALAPPVEEVKHLQKAIMAMQHRLDLILAGMAEYDTILAPIRSLPDEILEEVFYHMIPDDCIPSPSASASPLLPTFVCKRWRSIALSSPRLWSKLHIRTHPFKLDESANLNRWKHHRVSQTELWLSRSGSHPLIISIDEGRKSRGYCTFATEADYQRWMKLILALIGKHAHRWSTIVVTGLTPENYQNLYSMPQLKVDHLPLLRSVNLRECPDLKPNLPPAFRSSSLHHLSYDQYKLPPEWDTVDPNLLGRISRVLTELRLGWQKDLHVDRALTILGHCELNKLQKCDITLQSDSDYTNKTDYSVTLPQLTSLVVRGRSPDIFWERLTTPALAHISLFITADMSQMGSRARREYGTDLHGRERFYWSPKQMPLSAYLSKCPRLTSLDIDARWITAGCFSSILRSTPQLTELKIFHHDKFHQMHHRRDIYYGDENFENMAIMGLLTADSTTDNPASNDIPSGDSPQPIREVMMPKLVSIAVTDLPAYLVPSFVAFCKNRIYPLSSPESEPRPPFESLRHVSLHVGKKSCISSGAFMEPVADKKGADEICDQMSGIFRHAEGVGRRIDVKVHIPLPDLAQEPRIMGMGSL